MKTFKQFIKENHEHPMIDVDGVMKHKNNSEGKQIHHIDDGIRNFHRWFGDSKTVDEHGRPQVMYHGTSSDIDSFKTKYFGKGRDVMGSGFYFTNDTKKSDVYAGSASHKLSNDNNAPNVIPTYTSVKNPINPFDETPMPKHHVESLIKSSPNYKDALDTHYKGSHDEAMNDLTQNTTFDNLKEINKKFYKGHTEDFIKKFKDVTGHDGVMASEPRNKTLVTTFEPNQIKSAIGNNGDFHPHKDKITESK